MAKTNDVPARRITTALHEEIGRRWGTLEPAEEAFRRADVVKEYAFLISALAVWQIAQRKLYQPKFKTLEAYLRESKTRLGCSRAYFFEQVNVADAYMQYKDQLYAAGFKEEKDTSNLRLFKKAVDVHGLAAAIRNTPKMSFREFQHWIGGKSGAGKDQIDVDDDGIRYGGELVVSATTVARICEDGEEPFVIGVRSDSEKRAVSRYLRTWREGKDGKREKGGE